MKWLDKDDYGLIIFMFGVVFIIIGLIIFMVIVDNYAKKQCIAKGGEYVHIHKDAICVKKGTIISDE